MSLSGDMSCVGMDRSRTIAIFCCSVRPIFSVMCGLSCSLFMVVGCSCFYVVFIFYNRHLYFYLFYLISKGIFHLGGLVSKMHISVYVTGSTRHETCGSICKALFQNMIIIQAGSINSKQVWQGQDTE